MYFQAVTSLGSKFWTTTKKTIKKAGDLSDIVARSVQDSVNPVAFLNEQIVSAQPTIVFQLYTQFLSVP